jgi:hypothetical protein
MLGVSFACMYWEVHPLGQARTMEPKTTELLAPHRSQPLAWVGWVGPSHCCIWAPPHFARTPPDGGSCVYDCAPLPSSRQAAVQHRQWAWNLESHWNRIPSHGAKVVGTEIGHSLWKLALKRAAIKGPARRTAPRTLDSFQREAQRKQDGNQGTSPKHHIGKRYENKRASRT